MSATNSDSFADWRSTDWDCESEQKSKSGGKNREVIPASTLAPQPTPADAARRATGCQGAHRNCAATREPAAGLCKRQQAASTSPRNALKRSCSGVEEEEQRLCRPHQRVPESESDRAFSRKCAELQCYILPLAAILNKLRAGRYRDRLSSFQESVAMDRIQRIMGVLRNAHMGKRAEIAGEMGEFIDVILKMEEMLKSWFPHVKPQVRVEALQTEAHDLSKKRKVSPEPTCPAAASSEQPTSSTGVKALRVTDLTPPGAYSASNLKWLHTSPICSATAENLLSPRDRNPTQDNLVSSSTESEHDKIEPPASEAPLPLPRGKINAPCLESLLKATESIIGRKGAGSLMDSNWS